MGEVSGCSYAALEYVRHTLADRLRGGPLSVLQTARVCQAIVAALEYARQQQLVHLNLTPPSIFINDDDLPKLCDFEPMDRGRNVHGSAARRGFSSPEELSGGDGATVAADSIVWRRDVRDADRLPAVCR
jgi:serine/threonine protein kinase